MKAPTQFRKFQIPMFLLLSMLLQGICSADTYKSEESFGTIRWTYKDLVRTVSKVNSFTEHANAGKIGQYDIILNTISVSDKYRHGKTISGTVDVSDLEDAPDIATEVTYSYYSSADLPVSSIRLSLRDSSRTLSVEGNSPEQVEGVTSLIVNHLNAASLGLPFKFPLIGFLYFASGVGALIIGFLGGTYGGAGKPVKAWLLIGIAILLGLFGIWVLFGNAIHEVEVFRGDVSWVSRNPGLVAIIGFSIPGLSWLWRRAWNTRANKLKRRKSAGIAQW